MIILYAKHIESANWDYRKSFERLTVKKENITDVNFEERASDEQNGIISVKEGRFGYFIRLKENKNFLTVMEFFEYIRDYSEIHFETKEIPTKKEIKVGDIYRNNDRYFLVHKKDSQFVIGIINGSKELRFNFMRLTFSDLIKKWTYIGNIESAANKINNGLNVFENFVEDDASIPF